MDQIAAQNHGGLNGLMFIDIMTQPGNGPLRGIARLHVPRRRAERAESVHAGEGRREPAAGRVLAERLDRAEQVVVLDARCSGADQFDTTNLLAAVPGRHGRRADPPADRSHATSIARFDQAITKDHMVRFSFTRTATDAAQPRRRRLRPARARVHARTRPTTRSACRRTGRSGRRFFSESRLQVHWARHASQSLVEAPTIRVLDAFTSGGAQQAGGRRRRSTSRRRAISTTCAARTRCGPASCSKAAGTASNEAIELPRHVHVREPERDYEAGTAVDFTRRIGDPAIRYNNLQVGVYAQDDFRLAKSLML